MGHVWSEFVAPETTPLRDKPSQFETHFGFTTERREKSNVSPELSRLQIVFRCTL